MGVSAGHKGRPWLRLAAGVRIRHAPCGICGQPIDYTITDPNDPGAFTVDHIKSWIGHPELRTDPGNLRAAHRRCNSSKNARDDRPGLGLRSREW